MGKNPGRDLSDRRRDPGFLLENLPEYFLLFSLVPYRGPVNRFEGRALKNRNKGSGPWLFAFSELFEDCYGTKKLD